MQYKRRAYIETAINIIIEKGNVPITKELYPEIAKRHNTTPLRSERAIRHAIEVVFSNIDINILYEIFGNIINLNSGKISNSAFIYGIVEYLKINCEDIE